MKHVCITGLVKTYKSDGGVIHAVNGIDIDILHGEMLAITGASGSGKSTLLHLMGGLMKPTSGSIVIDGVDIVTKNDHEMTLYRRKNIGIVFQSFNLIPTLNVEENIMLPVLAGFSEVSEARCLGALEELVERLNLKSRRHSFPDTLSGGEQQRVAIARALFMDFATDCKGALLLADEPTGNLDSVNSEAICRIIKGLCRERNHTMVIATHEKAVAEFCDRRVELKDGRLV